MAIVRGYEYMKSHKDVFLKFLNEEIKNLAPIIKDKFKCNVLGGGKIRYRKVHEMKMYGTSPEYGAANHLESQRIVFKSLPDLQTNVAVPTEAFPDNPAFYNE